jgi:hypothetical protein
VEGHGNSIHADRYAALLPAAAVLAASAAAVAAASAVADRW